MPGPRQIAEEKNDPSKFDRTAEDYDAVTGTPLGVSPQHVESYAADVKNPPPEAAPAKNLKSA